MKVLMINVVCGIRSTGRICTDLAEELISRGHDVRIAYGRETVPKAYEKYAFRIGSDMDVIFHAAKSRILDDAGFGSKNTTEKFIQWIRKYDPDVIHLHNLHGYYINVESLFSYLKNCGKKIIWTLHDCWSFTGHCTYFDYVNCNKWKTACEKCIQRKKYPSSLIMDQSKRNFRVKEELFTHIPNMTIVTPSFWLKDLLSQSFLKQYPVKVIHNGINTDVFQPTASQIRKQLGCDDKIIVLGVAAIWDRRKGLDYFIQLASMLDKTYQIVLIGLSKDQLNNLPECIIGKERTNSVQELAELYSAADIFVNPTLEDNYPTTNIEAIACGTPVVSFETGGCGESANWYGCTVPKGDTEALCNAIKKYKEYTKQDVQLDSNYSVSQYLELYENG